MSILFVILSTVQNRTTRQQWQLNTWLKDVDYVYLDIPVGEEAYNRVAYKYVAWLEKAELKHDWYFFCDDDTFVFIERLEKILTGIRPEMIGFKGGMFERFGYNITWFSGGAGFGINKSLMQKIQLLKDKPVFDESDTTMGLWAAMTGSVNYVHSNLFNPFKRIDPASSANGVTYHYCDENDFNKLHGGCYK